MKRATEKGAHFAPFAGSNYDTDDKSIAITPDVYVMKESDESSLLSSEPHLTEYCRSYVGALRSVATGFSSIQRRS
jgi:hypothetical protein